MKQTAPKPTIYLRNNFTVLKNRESDFFYGNEKLLRTTLDSWTLVASCGLRSISTEAKCNEPSVPAMNIWKLAEWDTLYNTIFALSETEWYRRLGSTLGGEQQDFLVGVLADNGDCRRPPWKGDTEPGYAYLYEEAFPVPGEVHNYLRDLNWFTAQVAGAEFGWRRAWTATHITAQPSLISVLWRVPSVESIERTLSYISSQSHYSTRYSKMMDSLRDLKRTNYFPIYGERLDERIRNGEASIIKRDVSSSGGISITSKGAI